MILFLFLLVFFVLPLVGLAVDAGLAYVIKTRLSAAVDAAALAAARSLSVGLDISSQTVSAQQTAVAYFEANFPTGLMNAQVTIAPADVAETSDKIRTVTINATAQAPLYFASMFGVSTMTINASGQASRRDVNVVLVLDRSGSMEMDGVCGTMRSSAQDFVNMFSNGRDRVSLVTFKGNANLDFPNATDPSPLYFKPDLPNLITTLQCAGDTGTAQALTLAHSQFLDPVTNKLLYPGALNVVVFYTDGIPNGVSGHFQSKNPACIPQNTYTAPDGTVQRVMNGFLAQGPSGLFDMTGVPLSVTSDTVIGSNQAVGCSFQPNNSRRVTNDVAAIPDTDFYGNQISPGYWALPADPIAVNNNTINNASLNAADSAAWQIRNDGIVIYCIGESAEVDSVFLKRVANTLDSTSYNANQPVGLYIYSPDGGQLASAFDSIASQILRISQ